MPHVSDQHDQHDQLLVVSLAAGDLTGGDRDRATSQIADCSECARLNDDLLVIARATAALPAAVRPRDFQLSPEQAARLRPAGWRRFVAAFAEPRLAMTRQLGVGLTTLGIAGLMLSAIGSINLSFGMGAGAAPAAQGPANESTTKDYTDTGLGGAAPSAAAASSELTPVYAGSQPSASPYALGFPDASTTVRAHASDDGRGGAITVQRSQARPGATQASDLDAGLPAEVSAEEPGVSLIVVASVILLAAGIALLLARRLARRITTG
jgi:hypothetical protein